MLCVHFENAKNIWLTTQEFSIENRGVPQQKCALTSVRTTAL